MFFFSDVDKMLHYSSKPLLTEISVSTMKTLILIPHHFHTCLPVTTAQWSTLVDSCVCYRSASWLGWAGHSESQPGCLHWSDWFSGHTGPAVSAPLLRSSGYTPPIPLQTSWDNTQQSPLSQQTQQLNHLFRQACGNSQMTT